MGGPIVGDVWTRRGISLLWGSESLRSVAAPKEIFSMRQFLRLSREGWPEDLPSVGGDALVVAGLDGCLDTMSPSDAVAWIEAVLVPILRAFQGSQGYDGQAALIFWLPGGRSRVEARTVEATYLWQCGGEYNREKISLSRSLWGGAERDVRLIEDPNLPEPEKWVGLYHQRIS